MADYTFFFNPMSRAQIAHWAFLETKADFEIVNVDWEDKPAALLRANPMGKIPTIIHHAGNGDRVVSEAAAVCHYLAEMQSPDLLPLETEKADYFRWLFFAAAPLEQAITCKAMGWEPTEEQQGTVGFGDFDRTIETLAGWMDGRDYVCGSRFTMADVYVGSQVGWGLAFGTITPKASFTAYIERLSQRDGYRQSVGSIGE